MAVLGEARDRLDRARVPTSTTSLSTSPRRRRVRDAARARASHACFGPSLPSLRGGSSRTPSSGTSSTGLALGRSDDRAGDRAHGPRSSRRSPRCCSGSTCLQPRRRRSAPFAVEQRVPGGGRRRRHAALPGLDAGRARGSPSPPTRWRRYPPGFTEDGLPGRSPARGPLSRRSPTARARRRVGGGDRAHRPSSAGRLTAAGADRR